jgi:hypothetical protein
MDDDSPVLAAFRRPFFSGNNKLSTARIRNKHPLLPYQSDSHLISLLDTEVFENPSLTTHPMKSPPWEMPQKMKEQIRFDLFTNLWKEEVCANFVWN